MADGSLDYIVEDEPDPERVMQVVDGLVAYNDGRADKENRRPLGVFVRLGTEIAGVWMATRTGGGYT